MVLTQHLKMVYPDVKISNLAIPDEFIQQGKRELLLQDVGLTAENITRIISEEIQVL